MPAPESGSNGASKPSAAGPDASSNGAGSAPAGGQAAASSGRGLWGWIQAQRQRSAEGRKKLAALGLAAVLAYGARMDVCCRLGR